MTLRELIAELEKLDPATEFCPGFGKSHSWRGAYEEVAFDPVLCSTAGEMLAHARAAVGSTLYGWKGGEYECTLDTECNVARNGEYGGDSDRMSVWWASNVEVAKLRAQLAAAVGRADRAERERDEARRVLAYNAQTAVEWRGKASAAEARAAGMESRIAVLAADARRQSKLNPPALGDPIAVAGPWAWARMAELLEGLLAASSPASPESEAGNLARYGPYTPECDGFAAPSPAEGACKTCGGKGYFVGCWTTEPQPCPACASGAKETTRG